MCITLKALYVVAAFITRQLFVLAVSMAQDIDVNEFYKDFTHSHGVIKRPPLQRKEIKPVGKLGSLLTKLRLHLKRSVGFQYNVKLTP